MPAGRKYEGIFRHGHRTGRGIATAANGKKLRGGIWENGILVREERLILERNRQTLALNPVGPIGNFLTDVKLTADYARIASMMIPLFCMSAKKAGARRRGFACGRLWGYGGCGGPFPGLPGCDPLRPEPAGGGRGGDACGQGDREDDRKPADGCALPKQPGTSCCMQPAPGSRGSECTH